LRSSVCDASYERAGRKHAREPALCYGRGRKRIRGGRRNLLEYGEQQQQQLATIEADVKAKLNKLLTADQKKKLEDIGPPMGGPPMMN